MVSISTLHRTRIFILSCPVALPSCPVLSCDLVEKSPSCPVLSCEEKCVSTYNEIPQHLTLILKTQWILRLANVQRHRFNVTHSNLRFHSKKGIFQKKNTKNFFQRGTVDDNCITLLCRKQDIQVNRCWRAKRTQKLI